MLLATFDTVARGGGDGPRFLFPLLMLVLLGFGIAWLIRRRRGGTGFRHHHGPGGSPMSTLEDRFARGDIDRAEFEHRKAVLVGADVVPPAPAAPAAPAATPTAPPSAPAPEAPEGDQTDPSDEDDRDDA